MTLHMYPDLSTSQFLQYKYLYIFAVFPQLNTPHSPHQLKIKKQALCILTPFFNPPHSFSAAPGNETRCGMFIPEIATSFLNTYWWDDWD